MELALTRQVSCGAQHSVALTSDGRLFCWGQGEFGQVGDGDVADKLIPIQIQTKTPLDRDAAVCCGSHNTFVNLSPHAPPHNLAPEVVSAAEALAAASDSDPSALKALIGKTFKYAPVLAAAFATSGSTFVDASELEKFYCAALMGHSAEVAPIFSSAPPSPSPL